MPRIQNANTATPTQWARHEVDGYTEMFLLDKVTFPVNGWITGFGLYAAADVGSITAYLVLYNGTEKLFSSPALSWGTNQQLRTQDELHVRVGAKSELYMGFGASNDYVKGISASEEAPLRLKHVFPPPATFSGYTNTTGGSRVGYVDYTANIAPSTGTWRTPAANGAQVQPSTTIEGNLVQGADSTLDNINSYLLQVYRLDNSAMHTNVVINTTSTERQNGYFSRALTGLTPGVTYGAKFKSIDSWGAYSVAFSAERTFVVAGGATTSPTPVSPSGLQSTLSGYNYVATHNNAAGTPANRAQILFTNSAGTTLADSGSRTISVAAGANITIAEFHTDLALGETYGWKIRASDDAGISWGPYSALTLFNTPSPPEPPTGLSPDNNQFTSSPIFSAIATDPDGDPITAAQIDIQVVATGASVAGYPAAMGVNAVTGELAYTPPPTGTGSLTLGTPYRWRCRASDAIAGYGAYSSFATFTYAAGPAVKLVSPPASRTNLISQPSAEYDPALGLSNYWTTTNSGGVGQSLNRVADDNSPFGAHRWHGVVDASGNLSYETTNFIPINAAKSLGASIWAKTYAGTPSTSFQILCYNDANTLLDTVAPQSAGGLTAATPSTNWTRYGGVIGHIGSGFSQLMPAGTTKVKVRLRGLVGSAGEYGFDAISMSQFDTNPANTTERDRAGEWFGYADGDSQPLGDLASTDPSGYSWTDVPGDSPSSVLPILIKPASAGASVVINYSSPTATAKAKDRVLIDLYQNGQWVAIYDSNPTWAIASGTRTVIPLPEGVLRNEERYRIKVSARDTAGIEGESASVEFETYFTGPAQLNITIAQAIPELAQNYLAWDPITLLPGIAFAGIEVQRIDLSAEEPRAIIGVLTNPSQSDFTDHFPAAGRLYSYRVRQVEQVGLDQVGGLWSTVELSCNYYPYCFVKDVEEPTLIAAYETEAQNLVGYSEDAPVGVISPWGAERPTVLTRSKLRIRSGEVVGAFFPDAGWELGEGFLGAEARFEAASQILKRRKTVAILIPAPEPRKIFAAIMGEARTTFPYPPMIRGFEFSWQEVSYSEDYYLRAGLE